MRIFLSYASEDRQIAERVCAALMTEGHVVFQDRNAFVSTDAFHSRIREEILRCELFLFLASAWSVQAGSYALTELRMARERWPSPAGYILPVVLPGNDVSILPSYLSSVSAFSPCGNIEAEVLAEICTLLSQRRSRWRSAQAVFIGVVISALGPTVAVVLNDTLARSLHSTAAEIPGLLALVAIPLVGAWTTFRTVTYRKHDHASLVFLLSGIAVAVQVGVFRSFRAALGVFSDSSLPEGLTLVFAISLAAIVWTQAANRQLQDIAVLMSLRSTALAIAIALHLIVILAVISWAR